MDHVVDRAEKTVASATDSEMLLNEIAKNSETVSTMVNAISESSKQQNEAVQEISKNIEGVSSSANENNDMAKQSFNIANHLYCLCQAEENA